MSILLLYSINFSLAVGMETELQNLCNSVYGIQERILQLQEKYFSVWIDFCKKTITLKKILTIFFFFRRPYFTWWVTIIQIIVFIVTIATYGIASIGVTTTEETDVVRYLLFNYVSRIFQKANIFLKKPEGNGRVPIYYLAKLYKDSMKMNINWTERCTCPCLP